MQPAVFMSTLKLDQAGMDYHTCMACMLASDKKILPLHPHSDM